MLMDILMEALMSMDDDTLDSVLESCSAEELDIINNAIGDITPDIIRDEPANEGVLGTLFIGSVLFLPVCVGISLVVLNIQGAINKMKNNKIIKKYPGIDTRAEKCVNDINKLVYSCLKNRLEDNSYFKSKEFRQYETDEHKPESSGYYESTFNVDEGANTISIKYDNHVSLQTITVKYPSSEDDSTSSKNYNKIAQPVFDKVDKEFTSLMKIVNKDILSEISSIEKKYDCTIGIKASGSWPHIDGYMEDGYDYNNMRADSKISCQISFNV